MKIVLLFLLGTLACMPKARADFQEWLAEQAEKDAGGTRRLILPTSPDLSLFLSENSARGENILIADESPSSEQQKESYSVLFEGKDTELVIEKWRDLGFTDRVSMGVWIKPDFSMFRESREYGFVVGKSTSIDAGFFITITADRRIGVGLVTSAGNARARAGKALEMYRWHHVGWSWNGERLQVYIDGQPSGEAVEIGGMAKDYPAVALTFGRPADLDGHYYRGLVGDFILYPEAYEPEGTP